MGICIPFCLLMGNPSGITSVNVRTDLCTSARSVDPLVAFGGGSGEPEAALGSSGGEPEASFGPCGGEPEASFGFGAAFGPTAPQSFGHSLSGRGGGFGTPFAVVGRRGEIGDGRFGGAAGTALTGGPAGAASTGGPEGGSFALGADPCPSGCIGEAVAASLQDPDHEASSSSLAFWNLFLDSKYLASSNFTFSASVPR